MGKDYDDALKRRTTLIQIIAIVVAIVVGVPTYGMAVGNNHMLQTYLDGYRYCRETNPEQILLCKQIFEANIESLPELLTGWGQSDAIITTQHYALFGITIPADAVVNDTATVEYKGGTLEWSVEVEEWQTSVVMEGIFVQGTYRPAIQCFTGTTGFLGTWCEGDLIYDRYIAQDVRGKDSTISGVLEYSE